MEAKIYKLFPKEICIGFFVYVIGFLIALGINLFQVWVDLLLNPWIYGIGFKWYMLFTTKHILAIAFVSGVYWPIILSSILLGTIFSVFYVLSQK